MLTKAHLQAVLRACALALSLGALLLPAANAAQDERHSDLWLKAALVTTYTLNQHLNPLDIQVQVNDGVARLQGRVDSSVEKDLATALAYGVDGIRAVDNQLAVVEPDAPRGASKGDRFLARVNDANITAKVKSQLLWNSSTQGLRIDVDTADAVVSLNGEVRSAAESELAERIARNTSGVRKVVNRLSVNPEQKPLAEDAEQSARDAKASLGDTWITAKVKASLLYNRGVDAAGVEVSTSDGTVTLRGEVASAYEAQRAAQIATEIVGVRDVRNQIQVRSD